MSVKTLDTERLERWMAQEVPGFKGPLTAEKFAGGQSNPTYKLTAESGTYVLRRKPPGQLLQSAHAVDREFKAMSALQNTSVPVATPLALCEDDDVIGSMFYIMEFLPGRTFWDARLPEQSKEERSAIYDAMNQVLADLHSVDYQAVGLADYGKPGNYFERQVSRWTKQYRASETDRVNAMETLIEWLTANTPDDDETTIVHGDFRLDNMIFHPTEPRVIALVDWELSTLGHPLADLAYQCMQWRLPADGPLPGLAGLDRTELGLPTEAEYVQRYCERRGLSGVDNWEFYLAFGFFRLAAILQGIKKRAIDGNASNDKAAMMGEFVTPLAQAGVELIPD